MKLFFDSPLEDEKFHSKYKLLNNQVMLYGERKILEKWAAGFIDRDGKLLYELQTTFHSTFWEFYIHQLLKNMEEEIDFSKHRPDFIVKNGDGSDKFYIEAVVSEIKKTGRKEEDRNYSDIELTETPIWKLQDFENIINEGIIRCSNAFQGKLKKYTSYIKEPWVKTDVPYIIGMSSFSQLNYGLESHYSILALLYGFYLNQDGLSFSKRVSVVKQETGAELPLNIFDDETNSDISAVLFSSKVTLGKLTALAISNGYSSVNSVINIYEDTDAPYFKMKPVTPENPELFSDGLFLFHNPKAKNPLNPQIFKDQGIIQVFKEKDHIKFDGDQLPLICRVNRPLLVNFFKNLYMEKLYRDFNF